MRHAANFNSEWGYLALRPGFRRSARLVVVAGAIGATAGAAVVFSLVDRWSRQRGRSVAGEPYGSYARCRRRRRRATWPRGCDMNIARNLLRGTLSSMAGHR